MTNSQLIKKATTLAENIFDKQMLDLLDVIKGHKKLHAQHKFMLLEYCEADKYRKA